MGAARIARRGCVPLPKRAPSVPGTARVIVAMRVSTRSESSSHWIAAPRMLAGELREHFADPAAHGFERGAVHVERSLELAERQPSPAVESAAPAARVDRAPIRPRLPRREDRRRHHASSTAARTGRRGRGRGTRACTATIRIAVLVEWDAAGEGCAASCSRMSESTAGRIRMRAIASSQAIRTVTGSQASWSRDAGFRSDPVGFGPVALGPEGLSPGGRLWGWAKAGSADDGAEAAATERRRGGVDANRTSRQMKTPTARAGVAAGERHPPSLPSDRSCAPRTEILGTGESG
jgi:hypothetical protein